MGTTETKPTLADLERLLSEITPGPWMVLPRANSHCFDERIEGKNLDCVAFANSPNARAIAMLPDLLAEVIATRRAAELDESDLDEAWKSGFNAGFGEAKMGIRAAPMTLDTTAIRARAESAERDRDRLAAQYTSACRTIDQIATDRDALRAENERLREALRPFAKAGELFPEAPGSVEFDLCIYRPAAGSEWSLCGDDLRRARAALAKGGE